MLGKDINLKRKISAAMLVIYFTMIFQHVFLDCLHFVSHTSDLLTNQFTFHHHGDGDMHVHHTHDAMDLLKDILHADTDNKRNQEEVLFQFQFKVHIQATSIGNCARDELFSQQLDQTTTTLYSTIQDILTPPPKGACRT